MNILFLHSSRHESTPWRDGSTRYRCYHLADSLRNKGHNADIVSVQDVNLEQLDRYRVVVILRPRTSKALDQILKRCKRLRVRTVADVDDLIYVPKFSAMSPSVLNNQATELSVRSHFKRTLLTMQRFDEITTATEPLAHYWTKQTGRSQVNVIPNGLSTRWLQTSVRRTNRLTDPFRTITYLPGSNSHDKDFSEIVEVLAETLHSHNDTNLRIVGTLKVDEKLFPANRLMRSRWVDYYNLPQIIASSTVTLAPLVASPFNHCKSHIKFIESAAFGTPAICSPNHDICRHKVPGLHIAESTEDWAMALNDTLDNPMSDADLARMETYVRQNCTADQSADILLSHWKHAGLTAKRLVSNL